MHVRLNIWQAIALILAIVVIVGLILGIPPLPQVQVLAILSVAFAVIGQVCRPAP